MSDVVFIEISEEDSALPLSYKEDGARFSDSQTLKLCVDSKYIIRISCKEELKSQDMLVNGDATYLDLTTDNADEKVYEGKFNTEKIEKTKKGKRDVVALQIPLQYSLLVAVQCKYYKLRAKDSSRWGTSLKNIAVNYKVEDGVEGMSASVKSIKFRKVMP